MFHCSPSQILKMLLLLMSCTISSSTHATSQQTQTSTTGVLMGPSLTGRSISGERRVSRTVGTSRLRTIQRSVPSVCLPSSSATLSGNQCLTQHGPNVGTCQPRDPTALNGRQGSPTSIYPSFELLVLDGDGVEITRIHFRGDVALQPPQSNAAGCRPIGPIECMTE